MRDAMFLVVDEGTTSTRAMLFSPDGKILGLSRAELTQYYPAPGWVEQDADEILRQTFGCIRAMVDKAGGADKITAIGITNQRETVVAWDRGTGQPLCRAIVWQDRRTADQCAALLDAGAEQMVMERTGLVLDPYFSATKMRWILDHVPAARALGNQLAFGTIESWLVWNLTNGLHISDASNASRTMLMPLVGTAWDDELLDLHGIARATLPEIVDCAGRFGQTRPELFGGPIGICGLAGDQQAATIGQNCVASGQVKATLGTGAFVLASVGTTPPRSSHRLLGTVLTQLDGERRYALEGSIFSAGSLVDWLCDGLGLVDSADELETLSNSVADNGGVCIIPALSGLGAPYWQPTARAAIEGLDHGTGKAHIARAALETIAHQMADLMQAFAGDGCAWRSLRLDGGMSANDWLAQDLADMLGLPVERPINVETSALGAAMLASIGSGQRRSIADAAAMLPDADRFEPGTATQRDARLAMWHELLAMHGYA